VVTTAVSRGIGVGCPWLLSNPLAVFSSATKRGAVGDLVVALLEERIWRLWVLTVR
jgi:hypothetical protein